MPFPSLFLFPLIVRFSVSIFVVSDTQKKDRRLLVFIFLKKTGHGLQMPEFSGHVCVVPEYLENVPPVPITRKQPLRQFNAGCVLGPYKVKLHINILFP